MGIAAVDRDYVDFLIQEKGLEAAFNGRDTAIVDCPAQACRAGRAARLNQRTARVTCTQCGLDGSLIEYLNGLETPEANEDDNVVNLHVERADFVPDRQVVSAADREAQAATMRRQAQQEEQRLAAAEAERQRQERAEKQARQGKLGERLIITLLALIFLAAGLAAAALSGFANYQAFSASVGDSVQGQVWGWSGVIAAVCSFGGFTFFWWHTSAKRYKEGARALVFALAGAATSIAGTAMFMANNSLQQQSAAEQADRTRSVIEAQVADWSRQLDGIPATTRSVAGLEAYLAGVEAAGRTHQKPYRDAQNELGLARRRVDLEARIADARGQLIGADASIVTVAAPEKKSLPAWFFALMLEVFSSQGTSIAFVSLLLLYGARERPRPEAAQPDSGSSHPADPMPA